MEPVTTVPAAVQVRRRAGMSSRHLKDRISARLFLGLSLLPLTITTVMVLVLAARARPIIEGRSIWELLTGRTWLPLDGQFGFYPFIMGTLWVTALAMLLAVPPALFTAIYLAEYARPTTRTLAKPLIDLLAAIPSVVYGIWGVIAIVPFVGNALSPWLSSQLGFIPLFATDNPTGFSVLSGSLVLGLMVAPVIIAISYEVIATVPNGLREAALALGTTRWQVVKHAVLPKAFPGITATVVLAFSRAFGETMAVLMVVGNVARAPSSIFDPAYPLPALIANNYGEMMSIPLYDAALLGGALVLLVVILVFNILSTLVLQRLLGRRWT
jgi:phosphate transport system permease protein